MKLIDIALSAAILGGCASPLLAAHAEASDISFTFHSTYQGIDFVVADISADACAALVAKPVVEIITEDGTRLIVPATETKRACVATEAKEAPDMVLRFVGLDQPVKVFNSKPGELDRIQVGDGPKVELNMAAQFWSWETPNAEYYMVDNLQITDKRTGKETCYQEPEKQFSCEVNPVNTGKQFDADQVTKLLHKGRK